ncbi:hypothetical protein [Bradyrhizobium sp. OK095]|uniref:hypothetical protein n=1 Tax=Bradyrhizobium sp. OK095 TaxID=1882760 RepID=UPI0008C7E105|nr:hypothetical protein [Bradyrhizobium sp. OK095]SEM83956.1 hypothetical protein SAMN05443254_10486 [Bradyrhizobium sp. OK095]
MSDRFVRQIDPIPNESEPKGRLFSEFESFPNIVLVGDPGSGKSHLFEQSALTAGTKLYSTRTFLNTPSFDPGAILFIDALDERRAGRNDSATIDLIVQKLIAARPRKIRLACREHDWLGGTDLAAFHPIFSASGGHVVLSLQALTSTEQQILLQRHGISDPVDFLAEAAARDLADLLLNPQNLIMLVEAVRKKHWPKTKAELFATTTDLLLREHNTRRSRDGEGQYEVHEVRAPAGAAYALRLISDVSGISLLNSETDPQFPSYRSIPFSKPELVLAALGRRAFRASGNETVEYFHRMNAEYVAAHWLAEKVRAGLPLSRVRALIGTEGVPTPELRGLHAWLVHALPEHASSLIDADPFGVLIYGDAPDLPYSNRKRLLSALKGLAKEDPQFRPYNDSLFREERRASAALAALSMPDMASSLAVSLRDSDSPFGFKALILDALRVNPPLLELRSALLSLLSDSVSPYGLKHRALSAATRLGGTTTKAIANFYRKLGDSSDELRLRADIISTLYTEHFHPKDIVALAESIADCDQEILLGLLWNLAKTLPIQDASTVLDALADAPLARHFSNETAHSGKDSNAREIRSLIEILMVRTIQERSGEITSLQLWQWLKLLQSLDPQISGRGSERIKAALVNSPHLIRGIFYASIESQAVGANWFEFTSSLNAWLPFIFSDLPLRWALELLEGHTLSGFKLTFTYELALLWSFADSANTVEIFEALYNLGDRAPELIEIRTRLCTCSVNQWRQKDAARVSKEEQKRAAGRLKNLEQFKRDLPQIEDGTHNGWMIWAAQVYYGLFLDVDAAKPPRERLEFELGNENAAKLLGGMKTFLKKAILPTLEEISSAEKNNSYPYAWYAYLAGMDELWLESPSLLGFSAQTIASLMALQSILTTQSKSSANTISNDVHDWATTFARDRRETAKSIYLNMAKQALRKESDFSLGISELFHNEIFADDRPAIALELANEFPNSPRQKLEQFLQNALASETSAELSAIAKVVLSDQPSKLGEQQKRLWIVAGFIVEPNSFEHSLIEIANASPEVTWDIQALSSYGRSNNNPRQTSPIEPRQLYIFVQLIAKHFPNTYHPRGGWSGDRNAWDAAELVRNLLAALSADASGAGSDFLFKLASHPDLSTYLDDIKHALANQRSRSREMNYRQPTWAEAIAAISNEAPANIEDLLALVIEHMQEIGSRFGTANSDGFKQFWNEDSHGHVTVQKSEESARDVLLELIRHRLYPLKISVEPEGHMVADKRSDIVIGLPGLKVILELKRDTHPDLWTAHNDQLDRFYTRDPDASGYGIYAIFWYGTNRKGRIPRLLGTPPPRSPEELKQRLENLISGQRRSKLRVAVLDVSVPVGAKSAKTAAKKRAKKQNKRRKLATIKAIAKPGSRTLGAKKAPAATPSKADLKKRGKKGPARARLKTLKQ